MPTAGVVAIILAFAARKLWFRARKHGSLALTGRDPAEMLSGLLYVNAGVAIEIVGGSLAYVASSSAWRDLLSSLIRRGARITYLVSERDDEGERQLAELAGRGPGSLSVRLLSKNGDTADLAADYRSFHFLICATPAQLWLEGRHDDDHVARNCEYVADATADERWAARRTDFETLAAAAAELDLGSA
jgi:hypothetical protein